MGLLIAILFLVILVIAIIIVEPGAKKQGSVSLSEFDRFIDRYNNIPNTTKAGIKLDARKYGLQSTEWIDKNYMDIPKQARRGIRFFLH